MNAKVAIFMAFAILMASFAIAQDDTNQEKVEPELEKVETNETIVKLGPAPDAYTSYIFPHSGNRVFNIGAEIEVLTGFANKGNSIFNITHISASLMYPQDHRYFIQNYTKQVIDQLVLPNEHRAFVYTFKPDAMLEPREYGLVVSIFYTDAEEGNFTNVVFNSTIGLAESDESIDVATLFTYIGILGVAGLVGFIVYKTGRSFSKKGGGRRIEYGTQKATVVDNEWLEGTAAARSPKSPKSPASPTNARSPKKPKKS